MRIISKGIITENPIFVLLLGLCPALAVTDKLIHAFCIGIIVVFTLSGTNTAVSFLKDLIPPGLRLFTYIIIAAFFVTLADVFFHALAPEVTEELGIYLRLTAVNCLILGRARGFAERSKPVPALLDAVGMGIGFTLALSLIAFIRELLGSGSVTLFPLASFNGVISVPVLSSAPISVLGSAAGAFLIFGYLKAFFNWKNGQREEN
jgi:electron transport complex protein RnfE